MADRKRTYTESREGEISLMEASRPSARELALGRELQNMAKVPGRRELCLLLRLKDSGRLAEVLPVSLVTLRVAHQEQSIKAARRPGSLLGRRRHGEPTHRPSAFGLAAHLLNLHVMPSMATRSMRL